jgi:hypothetical protein
MASRAALLRRGSSASGAGAPLRCGGGAPPLQPLRRGSSATRRRGSSAPGFDTAALGLGEMGKWSSIWLVRGEGRPWLLAMKQLSRSARRDGALRVILPVAHGGGGVRYG